MEVEYSGITSHRAIKSMYTNVWIQLQGVYVDRYYKQITTLDDMRSQTCANVISFPQVLESVKIAIIHGSICVWRPFTKGLRFVPRPHTRTQLPWERGMRVIIMCRAAPGKLPHSSISPTPLTLASISCIKKSCTLLSFPVARSQHLLQGIQCQPLVRCHIKY